MTTEESVLQWFSNELHERLDDSGMLPYQLSQETHVSNSSIHEYLEGKALPNPWTLVIFAEILCCSVNDLLGYDEVEDTGILEHYSAISEYGNKTQYSLRLSNRIRDFMIHRNLTIESLAEYTGIGVATVRRWVSFPPSSPRTAQILRLCDEFDCTPSEILGY